jgi:N6-L-threonylcarbamoyladenine synthase
MVYVISKEGKPLMPCKEAKARHLLKAHKAKVIKRVPFTIKLLFECENMVQNISLGVDAGSKHIGLSATTEGKILFEADVELRNDVVELMSARREARGARRNRKTRYRKDRFDNRRRPDGWLTPSVRQKIETHLSIINEIHKLLPISNIVVEIASFDIQKIKNPNISGEEYQQGEQKDFWNIREYVIHRDNHMCQYCKGKSGDNILNVHHIESRKTGGNAPNNLITLCETCHKNYHAGLIELPESIKRGESFKDAAFMGIMRWAFYNELKNIYPNTTLTYGYITKNTRIENNLPKEHYIDARCISGHPNAIGDNKLYLYKKVRRHNRKIYKDKLLKNSIKKFDKNLALNPQIC